MNQYLLFPLDGYNPYIGAWLWALQDTRRRTLNALEGLDDETINWTATRGMNSISTLLYHIAAVEMSWLYEDILEGAELPPDILALMQYDVRDNEGVLAPVTSETLETHLDRLQHCRQHLLSIFTGMSREDFRRPRKVEDYMVTPEWVFHHLIQHEAEHRGQIGEIRKYRQQTLAGK